MVKQQQREKAEQKHLTGKAWKQIERYKRYTTGDKRRANSVRVREAVVAGGRWFQVEAARYENARRDSDRRKAGSSNSPAAVARVVR